MEEELFGKYTLTEGTVNYKLPEFDAVALAEEMYQEAIKANKEFIYREGTLTNEIDQITLTYEYGGNRYTIYLATAGKGVTTNEEYSQFQKIKYRDVEFLFNHTKTLLRTVKESESGNILIEMSTLVPVEGEFDPLEEMIPFAYSIMYNE